MMNQALKAGAREFFDAHSIFSGLPANDIDALARAARPQNYKKGEYLYRQSEASQRLSIIKDGWVRLYRGNADGEEGPALLFTRSGVLGERTVLPDISRHFFSAQIISDTQIFNIPGNIAKEIARHNPAVLNRIMLGLMKKINTIHVENEHMALLSAPQRVACLLLRLSSNMIGNGGTFTFPYDKSLAAAQLGMKRETFSRALMCLKRYGVCSVGSEIRIENFAKLSEFCCLHCSLSSECRGARCFSQPGQEEKLVSVV